jgi:predicted nucleic acid-binding protein
MTHILDTSAVIAHFTGEPGRPEVDRLIESGTAGVSSATWTEFRAVLRVRRLSQSVIDEAVGLYRLSLPSVPIDDRVADLADALRAARPTRIPAMDALIAGCAIAANAVLVHADAHFAAIPASLLKQQRLSDS